jgi:hypothetical protein
MLPAYAGPGREASRPGDDSDNASLPVLLDLMLALTLHAGAGRDLVRLIALGLCLPGGFDFRFPPLLSSRFHFARMLGHEMLLLK